MKLPAERLFDIRPVRKSDESFLWQMLCYAGSMPGGATAQNVAAAQQDAMLSKYVAGWGRVGDLGVLAQADNATPVGAAWIRAGSGEKVALGYPTLSEPELSIAVLPTHRGQEIGYYLLQSLATAARSHYRSIMLNVREEDSAVRLYRRAGFEAVGEMRNRVGGRSVVMRLSL